MMQQGSTAPSLCTTPLLHPVAGCGNVSPPEQRVSAERKDLLGELRHARRSAGGVPARAVELALVLCPLGPSPGIVLSESSGTCR